MKLFASVINNENTTAYTENSSEYFYWENQKNTHLA